MGNEGKENGSHRAGLESHWSNAFQAPAFAATEKLGGKGQDVECKMNLSCHVLASALYIGLTAGLLSPDATSWINPIHTP
jgi:hypothetical protein